MDTLEVHLVIEHLDNHLGEWTDLRLPFRPVVGDSVFALELPENGWGGGPYCEWARISKIHYRVEASANVTVFAQAEDIHHGV